MALNRKTFKKAAAAADTNLPSGYFNTVTYTGNGGTQKIGGYINRGAVFNGSSSRTHASGLTIPSTTSISMWVKPHNSTSESTVFSSQTSDFRREYPILIWYPANSTYKGFAAKYTHNGGWITSPSVASVNEWHHVVCIKNSDGSGSMYVDNSLIGSVSANTTHPQSAGFTLGCLYEPEESGFGNFFNGSIDQVRIFDKALSSNEVTTLSNETHASTTKSTTDIFSDNSGVALYQLDGNANDTGGVSGYIGEGAIFNGSSSNITLPTGSPFNDSNTIKSVSAWVKLNSTSDRVYPFSVSSTTVANDFFNFGYLGDSNNILLAIRDGSSSNQVLHSVSVTIDTNWHHIVAQTTGNSVEIYLDGVSQTITSTYSGTGSSSSWISYPSYGGSVVGNIGISRKLSSVFSNGSIDQVRVYNKALSSQEVTTLSGETASSNITISDLVAYYPMEGTSLDQEGSYHGTDTNVEYNYSGTASNVTYQDATNFSPDLVWIKQRSGTASHSLQDTVRGAGQNYNLYSDNTAYEGQYGIYGYLSSFDTNGFTVEAGSGSHTNANGSTYAAWCFNAGTDAAADNTDGNITSTVKANTDAGFSIVSYTGNGNASADVGHGLSARPELSIFKQRSSGGTGGGYWNTYHTATNTVGFLNESNSFVTNTAGTNGSIDISNMDSTKFGFLNGSSSVNNQNGNNLDYIAYFFHSVDEIQKVGSYTGTGSTNNIIETGFEPAFLMIKKTSGTSRWRIVDNKRDALNPRSKNLFAEDSIAETGRPTHTTQDFNFLSNGFEIPAGMDGELNGNNDTFIYLAIAADPDTTTPTVEDSFEVVTYTGTGSTQSIDTGFKPDLVWIKDRTDANSHILQDSIRGANKALLSNTTNAEITSTDFFTSFDSNGFTLPPNTGQQTNKLNNNYVAWAWKAGDHDDNLPQINTEGTIDSTVSVNDAAGFSIVKWTGDGNDATVGHGLSSQPELVITKGTANLATYNSWITYHKDLSTNHHLYLNTSDSEQNGIGDYFRDAAFSSTVIGLGNDIYGPNVSGTTMIAYCFTSITGYQSVGSYSGGSSGSSNVITTGFKPKFLLVKRTDASGDAWQMFDSIRGGGDTFDNYVQADNSAAEVSYSTREVNFTTNGFYWTNAESGTNISGGTYIYLAIK